MLDSLTNWASDVVSQLGYLGVALLVAVENLFPPIPSEVVLGFAGFTASKGEYTLVGMIAAATIGSLVGAWILYGLSAAVGPVRLRAILIRYGKWIGVGESDLDRAEAWFDRRSRSAVLVCRCVPLLRSVISVPAGFRRMSFGVFTLYTAIGSLVWNTGLIIAGYHLADQWERVLKFTEPFQTVVVIAIGVAVVAFIGRKLVSTRRERSAVERAHPGLTQEPLEQVVDELEGRAAIDPVLRSKLHED